MFRFESPGAFYWIVLAGILWLVAVFMHKSTMRKLKHVFNASMLSQILMTFDYQKRKWKWFLQFLVLSLMAVALARPQLGQNQAVVRSEGFEIIFAVDVSESMMAEDLRPSRLDQAKLELAKLVDLMPGNKVGLIAFAGSSVLMSPLTNDMGAIKMYLDSLTPSLISNQGTNIESAIQHSMDVFERGGVTTDSGSKVTRVILVASDGEDHEENALKAVEAAVQKNIRVFSIAYGTEKGGTIPKRDNFGYLKGYKTDNKGQTIITQVKGDFLKQVAQKGKGSFYFSVFGGNHIQSLVDDFKDFEKSQFESTVVTDYEERFQIVLVIAFVLGLIELILGERKRSSPKWRGRYVDSSP
ncbi:MAG: VWA domain-containing protein [Bdellovibrionaceae bacterium]|nr:VWA domain-containing protein [Pseudobdellovibrionaceae bacterium]